MYGFTLVDFSVPSRDAPMIHPVADAPSHALSYGVGFLLLQCGRVDMLWA